MGIAFRYGDYVRHVRFGGRTIKDGEAAAIWNVRGVHRQIIGPRRVWLYSSTIRFLNRHKAEAEQYLRVQHRDGRVENIYGPKSIYENPALHDSISVHNGIRLHSDKECIVVYKDERAAASMGRGVNELTKNSVETAISATSFNNDAVDKGHGFGGGQSKRVVTGPALFMPEVGESLHQFQWSATDGGSNIIERCHTFNVLHTDAHRTWSVTLPIKTSDGATFAAKLSIKYHMESLEKVLLTADPIQKMYASITADGHVFGNTVETEHLRTQQEEITAKLSSAATFPSLNDATKASGFQIDSVVVTGLVYSAELTGQASAEQKLAARLRAELSEKTQRRELNDLELEDRRKNIDQEAELERKQVEAKAKLEEEAHSMREAALERKIALMRKEAEAKKEVQDLQDGATIRFLHAIKEEGVDMTKFLCSIGGMHLVAPSVTKLVSDTDPTRKHKKSNGD